MTEEETVLTSRRALLRTGARTWAPGRLRITDRLVRFTGQDGAVVEVARGRVSAVRVARLPRQALVLDTDDGTIRVRCFAMPAIAALLRA